MEETRKMLTAPGFTHLPVHWPEWERLGEQHYRSIWKKEDRMAVDRFVAELPAVYCDRAITIHSLEGGKNR
jgi:hypothetical protein